MSCANLVSMVFYDVTECFHHRFFWPLEHLHYLRVELEAGVVRGER